MGLSRIAGGEPSQQLTGAHSKVSLVLGARTIIVRFSQCRPRVIILMADLDVRVVNHDGELLRHFSLDPAKKCQSRKDDVV